jgi:transcriptional regulator with XRE-family HTH domain
MGRRLRDLRTAAKLSQAELATAAGLTAKYISQLERGAANPSLGVLNALAEKALKMPLAAFFAYDTTGEDVDDVMKKLAALVASQPLKTKRRILRVIEALVESS